MPQPRTIQQCAAKNCDRDQTGLKPWCKMHEMRVKRHGDPEVKALPKWTPMVNWVFLETLAATGKPREAAKRAGISHTLAYQRRRQYAGFRAQWERAMMEYRKETAMTKLCTICNRTTTHHQYGRRVRCAVCGAESQAPSPEPKRRPSENPIK